MPSRTLRHQQLALDWPPAREQLAENARDTQDALDDKLTGRLVTVAGYTATGATTTRIALPAVRSARAALLVRAALSRDPNADVPVVARLNIVPTAEGLGVYEPQGLAQHTAYDLTFLVMD